MKFRFFFLILCFGILPSFAWASSWGGIQSNNYAQIPGGKSCAVIGFDYDTKLWTVTELNKNGSFGNTVQVPIICPMKGSSLKDPVTAAKLIEIASRDCYPGTPCIIYGDPFDSGSNLRGVPTNSKSGTGVL